MSGTRAGGLKARQTNLKKYGNEFYRMIGSKGGQNGHTGGFAARPELARIAGTKGGKASRRTGILNGQRQEKEYVWKGDLNEKLVFKKA